MERQTIPQIETEQMYHRAIARLEKEFGWAPGIAQDAIAEAASAYGVFLDDIARAVLAARSIKRGLPHVLGQTAFDRRPPGV
jgi:hypothetical protein